MVAKEKDQFSAKETKTRMEAALRGARISGHKPMSKIVPKRDIGKATAVKSSKT